MTILRASPVKNLVLRSVAVVLVLAALGAAGVWLALRPPPPLLPLSSSFTLDDVTLVSPGAGRVEHRRVTVRDGVIQRIEAARGAELDPALRRYAGAFVVPGLADVHTHLPPATPLHLTEYYGLLYLAHGVTAIRDVGDADGSAVPAARAGLAAGAFPGPRIYSCGPFVGGDKPARWQNTIQLKAPGDAAAAVARIKAAGHRCVKAYDDLTAPQIQELKTAAKDAGLPVLGHVPSALAYEEALLPEPQHFFGVPLPASLARDHILDRVSDWQDVDSARLDQIVETTLSHGLVNTPTLIVGENLLRYRDYSAALRDPTVLLMPRMYREVVWHPTEGMPVYRNLSERDLAKIADANGKKRELARRLHERGAKLLLGTDAQPFNVPGASLLDEMELFHRAGFTAEEVWAAGTRQAAMALSEARLGLMEEGAPADLLVFRRDPTRDLGARDSLEAVVAGGRLYTREAISATMAAWQSHFEGAVFDRVSVALARAKLRSIIRRSF